MEILVKPLLPHIMEFRNGVGRLIQLDALIALLICLQVFLPVFNFDDGIAVFHVIRTAARSVQTQVFCVSVLLQIGK